MEFITKEELAKVLKCSIRTIDRLRKNGMPELSSGNIIRFNLDEVIAWLKEGSK